MLGGIVRLPPEGMRKHGRDEDGTPCGRQRTEKGEAVALDGKGGGAKSSDHEVGVGTRVGEDREGGGFW